jgi:hypothetical protein
VNWAWFFFLSLCGCGGISVLDPPPLPEVVSHVAAAPGFSLLRREIVLGPYSEPFLILNVRPCKRKNMKKTSGFLQDFIRVS